jgi:arginine utilization regulatory protein
VVPVNGVAAPSVEETGGPDLDAAPSAAGVRDLRERRLEQEMEMIDGALRNAGGNVSAAARMLKVSRQLIHYKMRKYGLRRLAYRGSTNNDPVG